MRLFELLIGDGWQEGAWRSGRGGACLPWGRAASLQQGRPRNVGECLSVERQDYLLVAGMRLMPAGRAAKFSRDGRCEDHPPCTSAAVSPKRLTGCICSTLMFQLIGTQCRCAAAHPGPRSPQAAGRPSRVQRMPTPRAPITLSSKPLCPLLLPLNSPIRLPLQRLSFLMARFAKTAVRIEECQGDEEQHLGARVIRASPSASSPPAFPHSQPPQTHFAEIAQHCEDSPRQH